MTDPRAKYWLEAHRNIEESVKYKTPEMGYWLNLAVAGVNALMASLPDGALDDVMVELSRRERFESLNQKIVQQKIVSDLKG